MTYVISEPCVKDKTWRSMNARSIAAIDGEPMTYVGPASASPAVPASRRAPVEAICCEDDVPGRWAQFATGNVRFFEQPGLPGGASRTGPLLDDAGYIASHLTSR